MQEQAHHFEDVLVNDIIDISIRDGMNMDEEHLCDSIEKVIYPTSGTTKDGKELYIFNTEELKQGVRVSLCSNSGGKCKMSDSFPNHYRSECKQQEVYRQLLSLAPNGQAVKDHFPFPACCSCVLHRV